MKILSKHNSLSHYTWGDDCDGWNFVDQPELSIKQELMPKNASEVMHYHLQADQFFYVLKGTATFIIEGKEKVLSANEAIFITKGRKHKLVNSSSEDLEFLLCSTPSTKNDRIVCEQ